MSTLRKNNSAQARVNELIPAIAETLQSHRGSLITRDVASQLISMESLDQGQQANLQATFEQTQNALEDTELKSILMDHFGGDQSRVALGMEAAAITLLAAGDPESYQKGFVAGNNGAGSDSIVVDTRVAGVDTIRPSMESFTQDAFDKFIAHSVVVNALSAGNNSFEEAFFPTEVIEAGQSGVKVKVSIAYAYNRTRRAANGKPFEFEKKSLIHALEDHTLLEGGCTDVVPYAAAVANNGDYLVDAADVGNTIRTVNGVEVETRPLKFGTEVDLLAVSAHPALVGADTQNETDALDPNVSLGKVYLKINVDDGSGNVTSGVFQLETAGIPGALFTRVNEGGTHDSALNFRAALPITHTMKTVANTAITALGIHNHLGLAAGDEWSLQVKTSISGTVNSENANIELYANNATLGNVFLGSTDPIATSEPEYTDVAGNVTFELLGYAPKARRVNANLRQRGILIDNGESSNYYYPIEIGSPFSSNRPISVAGGGATVEGLSQALRTRSSNAAVSTLLAAEEMLQLIAADGAMPVNAPMIGSLFVRPTYHHRATLDLKTAVEINRSGEGYDDVRALVVDAVTTLADKLALESGYLAALEQFSGGDREYEVIVGTDPRIAGLLMKSGDSRTFGENRNYRIVSSLDKRMRNQIYVTFRRISQRGIDPLSFGAHLYTPALIHEVANSHQGGATVRETQVQPRELHTATLPILGRITVQNVDTFYDRA